MTTRTVSLKDLPRVLAADMKARARRIKASVQRAARKGRGVVKRNVPVAFGELRESVHTEDANAGARIVIDAPHAAAIENGSRPHTPPLEPLIAWVRLRGMQALATDRQRGRMAGTTTRAAAERVGAELASREHRGPGGYSEVDAVKQIAFAIQQSIAKYGTKPHAFARSSLPEIEAILDAEIRAALPDR